MPIRSTQDIHGLPIDRRLFMAGATTLAFSGNGLAQQAWPSRPIRLVVPFPPGGLGDLSARPIARAMERALGRPVIVDNRGGAGGAIGAAAVARGAVDGHTFLITVSSVSVLPEAERIMGRQPSFELSDLIPVARILADPMMLAVNADTPWRSLADLVEAARREPGTITYGSSGNYGTLHISMEMFAASAGIRLLHVPYRGAGPALNDVISGQIKALTSAPSVLKPQADAGRIRVLGCFGAARNPIFPDVPTFMELGHRQVEYYIWSGLFAPRATPPDVLARLQAVTAEAMAELETRAVFEQAGSPPAYLAMAEFAQFIQTDMERVITTVRQIGRVEGG
jgi:tripartite-type tricarboxylate transporter receptor subunit TctC